MNGDTHCMVKHFCHNVAVESLAEHVASVLIHTWYVNHTKRVADAYKPIQAPSAGF